MQGRKKYLLTSSLFIAALILAGCSTNQATTNNQTNSEGNKTEQTSSNTNQTHYSTRWQKGVPAKYAGYYATREDYGSDKNVFSPVVFKDNMVSYGLGDTMVLDDPKYKQLDERTFIIHGIDNHYNASHPDFYIKVIFAKRDGVLSLGIAQGKSDHTTYKDVRDEKVSEVTWYKRITSAEYQKHNGGSTNNDESADTNQTSDSTSSNSDSDGDMKYTIVDKDGNKYKSNYTIQMMRDKYNLVEKHTTKDGFEYVENEYEGKIITDPIVHTGDPSETHAEGSLQLTGNWAVFNTKMYDGGNATNLMLVNLKTGEKYHETT